jgi:hypothetical protein
MNPKVSTMQNLPIEQSDSFDQFLRSQLSKQNTYIDDAGFSAGVMAQLAQPKRVNPWLKTAILILPMLLIALAVASQFPWRTLVQEAYATLLQLDVANLFQLGVCLMLAIFAWVFYLCRREQLL